MTAMTGETTELDARFLNALQDDFPVVARPYAVLAERLGAQEEELVERAQVLKAAGIIRQISAIFDTRALGYQSQLVAARIPAEQIDAGAEVINAHPGVSHNYKRNHAFNLWFTIATPPGSDLPGAVQQLGRFAGAESIRMLPTLRLFKIGVNLDMAGDRAADARSAPQYSQERRETAERIPLTRDDIALVRLLQEDLPPSPRPFAVLADRAGCDEDSLLAHAARMTANGHLRRIAAILAHRRAGFVANGMAVWKVPEDRVLEVGPVMASFSAVSHCYQRPVYEDWPYNIFTMIHGRKARDCEAVAGAIEEATGVRERAMLYSSREYKKVRLRYFTPEWETWEERVASESSRLGLS